MNERDTELAFEIYEIRMPALPIRLGLALPTKLTAIVDGVIVFMAGQEMWHKTFVAMAVSYVSLTAAFKMFIV